MQIAELIVSDNVREVDDMKRDPFEEYLKESEPDKQIRGMRGVLQSVFRLLMVLKHRNTDRYCYSEYRR